MNRTILNIVALVAGVVVTMGSASAQNIERMRSTLGLRSIDGARVDVVEDRSTQDAIAAVENQPTKKAVLGYRVVLFYDDAQFAHDRANDIIASFNKEYPEINSYIVYEKPYFKVSVGDCLSSEEALILRNRLIGTYSGAFVRRDSIDLATLTNVRRRVDCLQLDPLVRDSLLYHRPFRDQMRKDETLYIVMKRDSTLGHLLFLDDLARSYGKLNMRRNQHDPEWVNKW
ncbi:MAG: hypothetical protein IKC57_03630 [Alistipes sp.]|nr:hypothetical protein [Alistipes sp.]